MVDISYIYDIRCMVAKSTEFPPLERDVATIAKALSHPARIAILKILAAADGCMCGDIVEKLPLAQSTVSQHLKYLKEAGLITGDSEGTKSCYCANFDAVKTFRENFDAVFAEIHTIRSGRACC